MFKFAQQIFRHKVGVIAVLAFAVFLFSRDGREEAAKPASPWSKQSEVVAAAPEKDEDSIMSGAVGKAVSAASEYVGETTGINPMEMKEQTVDSFSNTAEAMKQANQR